MKTIAYLDMALHLHLVPVVLASFVLSAPVKDSLKEIVTVGEEGTCGLGLIQRAAAPARLVKKAEPEPKKSLRQSAAQVAAAKKRSNFDCQAHSQYCGDPLNCDVEDTEEEIQSWEDTFAKDGVPNLKAWCYMEDMAYENSLISECFVHRNLSLSGMKVFEEQKAKHFAEYDASYCFIVGHCDADRAVADNAMIQEGVDLCDQKYGREAWSTQFGRKHMDMDAWTGNGWMNQDTGFHHREPAHAFAKMACAMGNYHCDVRYCQVSYCNNEYYKKRYGCYAHQDPEPGHVCPEAEKS